MPQIVADNVNGPISPARQRVFDHTLYALRTHRANDNFAAQLFSDAQRFLKRITVGFTDLKGQVPFFNPRAFFINPQDRIFVCDLLHHHKYFHRGSLNPGWLWWSLVLGLWSLVFALIRTRDCY